MVKVIFYNLLRSKYGISELFVNAGSIDEIINQILQQHQKMVLKDFESVVVFHNGISIHHKQFDRLISDKEEIIFTHFVGGG
ncbi:hypothetical protein RJI07_03140 [Mycoplasmatota bacterium WC30]